MNIWRTAIGGFCLMAIAGYASVTMTADMEKVLEANLPAAIGTILGGIIAAATFLFTILRDFTQKKIAQQTSAEIKEKIAKQYKRTAASVRRDLLALTICLLLALTLPIVRPHPIVKQTFKINETLEFKAQIAVTFFELFTLLISIAIIWELIDTMFLALQEEL